MDRDHSDNASPKELSSFDVAKMSEAEVAAEIAQRMTRWRRARSRGDGMEPAPRADRSAAPSDAAATPDDPTIAPALSNTAGARMERALQRATAVRHHPPVAGLSAESIDIATPMAAPAVRAAEHPRTVTSLVRRARWPLVAAALLAAGAIAAWLLLPLGRAPPITRQAEVPPASPAATPAPDARAPSPVTAAPPAPASVSTLTPARTSPASKQPIMAARLKPDATAASRVSPAPAEAQPASAPLSSAPPPRSEPQKNPAPGTTHGTGKDDDLNDLFERMFSDGLGDRLP